MRYANVGEYYSNKFKYFYKKYGIVRHKNNPYTPQQNEVEEILNRSLMEKVRSILSGVGLVQEFRAKVVDTT